MVKCTRNQICISQLLKMKKNVILCVDFITRLQEDAYMKVGKNYKGVIRMTEANEKLEFDEQVHRTCERNPIVWTGEHINIHKTKDGRYSIHLKKTELSSTLKLRTLAIELLRDAIRAKVELGL